jgi:molybdopterin-synthase adenylyltransferase
MELSKKQIERYARQIILPDIGGRGQKKLLQAKVLVIGAGGLGSSCVTYLSAAGIGTIGILDFDIVRSEDLQRQIIHSEGHIGMLKVNSAKRRINEINSDVTVRTYPLKLVHANAAAVIPEYDIIADCTDNLEARYLINDTCLLLDKPFVHAAILQFYGQAMTVLPGNTACYRCLVPEGSSEFVESCEEAGVIGTIAGVMGTIQANEIIRWILDIGALMGAGYYLSTFWRCSLNKYP